VELFRNTNIDFLGKKWIFIALSTVLGLAGLLSILVWHGVPLGVDFRGGTLVYVKFTHRPDENAIRQQMQAAGLNDVKIQRIGAVEHNEVLISLDQKGTSESALDAGKNTIVKALQKQSVEGKLDLNNVGTQSVQNHLLQADPLRAGTDAAQRYGALAAQIIQHRDRDLGGVMASFDDLKGVVPPEVISSLEGGFYLTDFGVRNVEIVGPQVGKQLQKQAILAVVYSLIGMLVYLWFRFELIYGVAAVAAVFHDVLITLGIFSLTNTEISLTVIAALLTLVGYSMNDTIVVFDRIRENVKMMRRERFSQIVNRSINDTLSRTVLTSGLTFLTVLALFLWGGEVLYGFSLALVIGIIVGSYSSIFIAAPMLASYVEWREQRGKAGVPAEAARKEKARVKA